eukprot:9162408-Pyramimonas_sp.AAC.1
MPVVAGGEALDAGAKLARARSSSASARELGGLVREVVLRLGPLPLGLLDPLRCFLILLVGCACRFSCLLETGLGQDWNRLGH